MKKSNGNLLFRIGIVSAVVIAWSGYVLWNAGKTIFIDAPHWQEKAQIKKRVNQEIEPERGNILSCDGKLLAATVPTYYLEMDCRSDGVKLDSLKKYLVPLSVALSEKLKDKTPAQYRDHIMAGYRKAQTSLKYRNVRLSYKRVSHTDLKEIRQFPYLKMGAIRSGFHVTQMMERVNPFGELGGRTIGDVYGDRAKGGRFGIELQYDSLLRGKPGNGVLHPVGNRWVYLTEENPENGCNIRTTIDIAIQDIAHQALSKMLQQTKAIAGTVVVMEVKSGKVKAISNLTLEGGKYIEKRNDAVAHLMEPGSTFKTASMMVALENGIVSPTDTFDTGNGKYPYRYGKTERIIYDHNWRKGGYGKITAAQAMWYSSNIGIAQMILKGYEHCPEKYVDEIYKLKINEPVDLQIPGSGKPYIKHPIANKAEWYGTTLPWMSFGYETQIPPIYTLMFYNGIANDGKMVKPYFVEAIEKEGEEIESFSSETVNSSLCSNRTLHQIQQMLREVVTDGTATAVNSPNIAISGKTGTAQVSQGSAGYKSGIVRYNVSFCGYFPSDDPQYSAIAVVQQPRVGYPSGGGMPGKVVRDIAEQIWADQNRLSPKELVKDSLHLAQPIVRNGDYKKTKAALKEIDATTIDMSTERKWVVTTTDSLGVTLNDKGWIENLVPSAAGMGARDATYLMESLGLRVHLVGNGRVYRQSIPAGRRLVAGSTITLYMR